MKPGIDAGHGGKDPGAVGYGLEEEDVNLDVALKLDKALRRCGIRALLTRDADEAVPLAERCAIANRAGCDLFVSVHANAAGKSAKGSEAIYHPGSTKGKRLADLLEGELEKVTPWADRGIYADRRGLAVLKGTNMPAAIIELDFVTNPDAAKLLKDPAYRSRMAEALARAICRYYGKTYVAPTPAKPPAPAGEYRVVVVHAHRDKVPALEQACAGLKLRTAVAGKLHKPAAGELDVKMPKAAAAAAKALA